MSCGFCSKDAAVTCMECSNVMCSIHAYGHQKRQPGRILLVGKICPNCRKAGEILDTGMLGACGFVACVFSLGTLFPIYLPLCYFARKRERAAWEELQETTFQVRGDEEWKIEVNKASDAVCSCNGLEKYDFVMRQGGNEMIKH